MRVVRIAAVLSLTFVVTQGLALAEEVKITGMHNCCGGCAKAITETLSKIDGVSEITAEAKSQEISFQAADRRTARRAIGALARDGFHGKSDNEAYAFPDNSAVKEGKVTRLSLSGVHNCCPICCKVIKGILAKVDGVESDTVKPKEREFVVEGNFDGAAVVKALNEAGFHVRDADAPRPAGKKKKKAD